jgi:hypothetical protein
MFDTSRPVRSAYRATTSENDMNPGNDVGSFCRERPSGPAQYTPR